MKPFQIGTIAFEITITIMMRLIFIISTRWMGGGEEWRIYWIQTSQFLPKIKCKSFVSARSPLFFTLYTMLSQHTLFFEVLCTGRSLLSQTQDHKKHKHGNTEHRNARLTQTSLECTSGGRRCLISGGSRWQMLFLSRISLSPPSFSPRNSFRRKTTFLPLAQEFLPSINNFLLGTCLPTFLWRDMCCLV